MLRFIYQILISGCLMVQLAGQSLTHTPHVITTDFYEAPYASVAADINGDGLQDVAFGWVDSFHWFRNVGGGTFVYEETFHVYSPTRWFRFADVDGDSIVDYLCTGEDSNQGYSKILMKKGNGNGSFGSTEYISAADNIIGTAFEASDIDGDGDTDIAGVNKKLNTVAWIEQDTSGNFISHVLDDTTQGPQGIEIADLDEDGYNDILVSYLDASALIWFRSLNGQGFERIVIEDSIKQFYSARAADVDGDGDPDIVASIKNQNRLVWYRNIGNGQFQEEQVSGNPTGGDGGHIADLDMDGDLDIVSSGGINIYFHLNDGNGNFVSKVMPSEGSLSGYGQTIATGDMNQDGIVDIITPKRVRSPATMSYTVFWYEGKLENVFNSSVVVANLSEPLFFDILDFDESGDNDMLTVNKTFDKIIFYRYANDSSKFVPREMASDVDRPWSIRGLDIDGDGDLDAAAGSGGLSGMVWCENDGSDRNFTTRSMGDGRLYESLAVADLDGDGIQDVVGGAASDGGCRWFKYTGNGNFTRHTIATESIASVTIADMDNDGDADVITASSSGDIKWHSNNGAGQFSTQSVASQINGYVGAKCLTTADMDNDGDVDIIAASYYTDQIQLFENQGGVFLRRTIAGGTDGAVAVSAGDVDYDGDIDVASVAIEGRLVYWHRNDGVGTYETNTLDALVDGLVGVEIADIDYDGDLDVSWNAIQSGTISWAENVLNPTSISVPYKPISSFSLEQNYPNPFNPSTIIRYAVSSGAGENGVSIIIYNQLGQQVRTLSNLSQIPGTHEVVWDARNDAGTAVASGIYLYRLTQGEKQVTRKMLLLR